LAAIARAAFAITFLAHLAAFLLPESIGLTPEAIGAVIMTLFMFAFVLFGITLVRAKRRGPSYIFEALGMTTPRERALLLGVLAYTLMIVVVVAPTLPETSSSAAEGLIFSRVFTAMMMFFLALSAVILRVMEAEPQEGERRR
jgi:hypothetical protein